MLKCIDRLGECIKKERQNTFPLFLIVIRVSECVARETYKIHHLIASISKTLSVTLCHRAVGEVRGEDSHQTIIIAMIEQIQEWTYCIAKLVVLQWFQSYIVDGKDADIAKVAVLVFLLFVHRGEFIGIDHLQACFGRIAVIVQVDRIGKVREADEQLESTDGGCLAIAWPSSKDKTKRSIRVADPSSNTRNAFLYSFILLIESSPVFYSCLIEPEKDLISVLNEEPFSASRRLLAVRQAR